MAFSFQYLGCGGPQSWLLVFNLLAAVGHDRGFQFSISWLRWATIVAFSFQSLGCGGPRSWLSVFNLLAAVGHNRGSSKGVQKNVILATLSLTGKLYPLCFEKRRVSLSVFTFNMAFSRVNTDAEDSDFDLSTSEEEIDLESESSGFLSLSFFSSDYVFVLLYLAQNRN